MASKNSNDNNDELWYRSSHGDEAYIIDENEKNKAKEDPYSSQFGSQYGSRGSKEIRGSGIYRSGGYESQYGSQMGSQYGSQYGSELGSDHGTGGYGDDAYSLPQDELDKMYAKRNRGRRGPAMTIRDGAPPPEEEHHRSYVGLFVLFILIVIPILGIGWMFYQQREIILLNGQVDSVSLPKYLWLQVAMEPDMRAMQSITEDQRAYLITKTRIEQLWADAYIYLAENGEIPKSPEDLVKARITRLGRDVDGWDVPFFIEKNNVGDITVRSSGIDRSLDTYDDLVYQDDALRRSDYYEDLMRDVPIVY